MLKNFFFFKQINSFFKNDLFFLLFLNKIVNYFLINLSNYFIFFFEKYILELIFTNFLRNIFFYKYFFILFFLQIILL